MTGELVAFGNYAEFCSWKSDIACLQKVDDGCHRHRNCYFFAASDSLYFECLVSAMLFRIMNVDNQS